MVSEKRGLGSPALMWQGLVMFAIRQNSPEGSSARRRFHEFALPAGIARLSLRWALLISLASLPVQAAGPDARQGESAAAGARPLAGLFGGPSADEFRKAVAAISGPQVFEGLPDAKTAPALFAKESARSDVMRVGDSKFYSRPLELDKAEIAELRAAFNPGNPFSPGSGGDPCGRFHADYLLLWKSGEATYYAQIGLGCQEIEASGPAGRIHSYIPPDIYARLDRVLGKHDAHRPQATP